MLRPSRLALGGALALTALAPAQTTTQATRNAFAAALPADTMMYVSLPNISASLGEMQSMPLAKMWHEEEVQDFFERSLAMAGQYWEMGMAQAREMHEQGALPFDPDELLKLRVESASFAITSMSMTMPEGAREPLPHFGFVMHADFGDSAPIWRSVLETGLGMMQMQAGNDLARTSAKVGDVELMTFSPAEPPMEGFDMGLNIAFVGNGILIGSLTDEVTAMLGRLTSGTAGLTGTAAYSGLAQNVSFTGAEAEMFVRPNAFVDFGMNTLRMVAAAQPGALGPIDVDGVQRALGALGLSSIGSIASASRYENGRAITQSFVASPAEQRTGMMAMSSGELDMGFLKWVPKDAVSFSAMKFDPSMIWNGITGALRAYDEKLAEQMMGQLAQMEEQLGMSVENDLFGAFGDDIVTWQMPMAAIGTTPEMAIVLEVPEPERLLRTLDTISQLSQGKFSVKKTRRETYRVNLDIDLSEMGGDFGAMGMNPLDMFTPTFAFQDGYMVVGFSTGDVMRAFKRLAREDDPSDDIRSNPEFAPYLKEMPESGVDSLTFTDWKSSFESTYQILASMTMLIPISEDVPFEPELLPESSTLTQHLFGSVTWSRTTPEGFYSTSVSPFGPEAVALLAGGVGAGAAVFGIMSARDGGPIRIR